MQISVFGLGYVGAVTAACLAELGHEVVGVDVNQVKLDLISAGRVPVIEPGLQERITSALAVRRLHATADPVAAVLGSQVSLICVGTPANQAGGVSLDALESVLGQIGSALRTKRESHSVVVRSTIPPGTMQERVVPILQAASGRRIGEGLELCFNPEFLREGSAIKDFYHPPFTVIGAPAHTGPLAVEEIYRAMGKPVFRTSLGVAEAVKYVCNAFHALKITFANEVGSVLKAKGIDGREVMRLAC
jgi:GDP-mannose 6-dehydrogenase